MAEATEIGPEDTPTRPKGMTDAEWVKELRMNQAAKVFASSREDDARAQWEAAGSQTGVWSPREDGVWMGEDVEVQQSPRAMQGGKGQTKEDAREQWFRDWSTNRKSAAIPVFEEGEDTYDFDGAGGYKYRVSPYVAGPEQDDPTEYPPGIEILEGPTGVGARFGSARPVRYDTQGRDMARIASEEGERVPESEYPAWDSGEVGPRWDMRPSKEKHPEYASILEELDEYITRREGAGGRAKVAEKGYLDIAED